MELLAALRVPFSALNWVDPCLLVLCMARVLSDDSESSRGWSGNKHLTWCKDSRSPVWEPNGVHHDSKGTEDDCSTSLWESPPWFLLKVACILKFSWSGTIKAIWGAAFRYDYLFHEIQGRYLKISFQAVKRKERHKFINMEPQWQYLNRAAALTSLT